MVMMRNAEKPGAATSRTKRGGETSRHSSHAQPRSSDRLLASRRSKASSLAGRYEGVDDG